jgi:hypothetical protein
LLVAFLAAIAEDTTSTMDTWTNARAPDPPTTVDEHTQDHQQQRQSDANQNQTGDTNPGRHPSWLPDDMHYLKGPAVGPTDSMLVEHGAVRLRNSPRDDQRPTTEATHTTNTNTGTTQRDSIPWDVDSRWDVDSNTIMIGTSSPTPGPENNETVQVMVAQLVEEDQVASAAIVPPNALQQCLPDTSTPGGRRLCFGIVALLILGAIGPVTVGILCSSGLCSPSNDDEPSASPVTNMQSPVELSFNPTAEGLPTTPNPTLAASTTSGPTTQMQTLLPPTIQSPTLAAPITSGPTMQMTTLMPTTKNPTSAAPTTSGPTTQMPTLLPTTRNPTSAAPTTSAPTTRRPTVMPTPKPSTRNPTAKPTSAANPTNLQTPAMAPGSVTIFGTSYDIQTTTELGLMTALTVLELSANHLTGPLPTELGLMTALERLDLPSNYQLTGTLPTELGLMTSLTTLDLSFNPLTGTLPTELGLMTALTYLDLHANQLTGTLPTELGLMTALTTLFLSGNQWTGTIPSSYCNVLSLDVCALSCPCSNTDCCF